MSLSVFNYSDPKTGQLLFATKCAEVEHKLEKYLLDASQIENILSIKLTTYRGDVLKDMLAGKFGDTALELARLNNAAEEQIITASQYFDS